jgi:hypothetical protein
MRRSVIILGALSTSVSSLLQPPKPPTNNDLMSVSRRGAVGGLLSGCFLLAPSPAKAVLDARGNQLGGLADRTGDLDQTPFSVVVDGVGPFPPPGFMSLFACSPTPLTPERLWSLRVQILGGNITPLFKTL